MNLPGPSSMEGVDQSVSWLMRVAQQAARTVLSDNHIAQDDQTVRSLALTILGAAAELTAGGNLSRPAFGDYMSGAVTVLENDCSAFCRKAGT